MNLVLSAKKPIEAIVEISEVFFADMSDVTDDEFKQAVIIYRKKSHYFPVIKDILDCVHLIRQQKKAGTAMLPYPELTDEQIAENKKRCREIIKMIHKKRESKFGKIQNVKTKLTRQHD